MSILTEIEKSIIKRYRKYIWSPFINCINKYKQIDDGDKIAVFIDGSAQSYLAAKCLEEIKRHGKKDFSMIFFTAVPQAEQAADAQIYMAEIMQNARILGLELKLLNCQTDINSLASAAAELGANTLAAATVFERVAEKILYNLLERGKFSTDTPNGIVCGIKVINVFYLIRRKGVAMWAKSTALNFAGEPKKSELEQMRQLIDELNENYHLSELNIVRSLDNVNIDTLISYSQNGKTVDVYQYIKSGEK